MQREITLPDGYTGQISEENAIIDQINSNFATVEDMINHLPDKQLSFDTHVADFEEYSLDVFFGNNKKQATITIDDNEIVVSVGETVIRIDSDGNIVQ